MTGELRRAAHRWLVLAYFTLCMMLAAWSRWRRARDRRRMTVDVWPW